MFPEYVVHKLDGLRGDDKGNFVSRAVFVGIFIQAVRYNNPYQKGMHIHIDGISGPVRYVFCGLISYLYAPSSVFFVGETR